MPLAPASPRRLRGCHSVKGKASDLGKVENSPPFFSRHQLARAPKLSQPRSCTSPAARAGVRRVDRSQKTINCSTAQLVLADQRLNCFDNGLLFPLFPLHRNALHAEAQRAVCPDFPPPPKEHPTPTSSMPSAPPPANGLRRNSITKSKRPCVPSTTPRPTQCCAVFCEEPGEREGQVAPGSPAALRPLPHDGGRPAPRRVHQPVSCCHDAELEGAATSINWAVGASWRWPRMPPQAGIARQAHHSPPSHSRAAWPPALGPPRGCGVDTA